MENEKINIRNMYIELLNKLKGVEGVDIHYIDQMVQLLEHDIDLIEIPVNWILSVIPSGTTPEDPLVKNSDLPSFTQVNSDWNATSGVAKILNKPSIPAAQVNSDWNASTGVAQILNKPSIINVAFEELEIESNFWHEVIGQTYYEYNVALTDITSYVDIPAILCDRGNNTQYSLITEVITAYNSGVGYVTLTLRSNTLPTTTINAGVYVFTH